MSDEQNYFVRGRYVALYPGGKESGPIGYNSVQLATDAPQASDTYARAG